MSSLISYPIAAFKTLPLPTAVASIAGRIAKAFPSNPCKGNTAIQNFFLKDETSGAEVRCGVWDFPQDLREYEGGYVEFEAVNDSSIVWKEQHGSGNKKPEPKVEIKTDAKVLHLIKASDYHGPISVPPRARPAQAAAPSPVLRVALPSSDMPERPLQTAPAPAPSGGDTPQQEIENIVFTYQLCIEHVHAMQTRIKQLCPEGDDRYSSPAMISAAVEAVFIQATRDGIHRRVDAQKIMRSRDPNATPEKPTPVQQLAEIIGSHEREANAVLLSLELLPQGQTWQSLSPEAAEDALNRGFEKKLRALAA